MKSPLHVEDRGPVRVLSLGVPPSNPLSRAVLAEVRKAFAEAAQAPSVRAVVLASSLPKYFSSGLDLEDLFSVPQERRGEVFRALIQTHRDLAAFPKPAVAAVGGTALLGGFILTLACDWRLVSPAAKVSLSEIRLGLSPTSALVRLVMGLTGKPGLVKDLVLKGETLSAQEALDAGLADRLLPAEGFLDACVKEADKLAKSAPNAYASVKRALREALMGDEDKTWAKALLEFEELVDGPEAGEGLAAAREKRRPRWQ